MRIPTFMKGDPENYQIDLNRELRNSLSDDGMVIPTLTDTQILSIEPTMPVGTLWFSSNSKKLKVKTDDGVIETITSV